MSRQMFQELKAGPILVALTMMAPAVLAEYASAYPRPGTIERVSVRSDGAQSSQGDSTLAAMSGDARYVAFQSEADDLVFGDTNSTFDVFVHDRSRGTTNRVSVSSDGTQGFGQSALPDVSRDGRFVVFQSSAPNLVLDDSNDASDIFVHDLTTGTTERVSFGPSGAQGMGGSYDPEVSGDGSHVAFGSSASNLVVGDSNRVDDIFVHDRVTHSTERVSVASDGSQAALGSSAPTISSDGRYIAFQSDAPNLVLGDTNGLPDIFLHDRVTRVTQRVSVSSHGHEAIGGSFAPAISDDGLRVAFDTWASNLIPGDTNGTYDVFVRDVTKGITQRVSVSSHGSEMSTASQEAAISSDGRFVAFYRSGVTWTVHLHDRYLGSTQMVSADAYGAEGNSFSLYPAVSLL